VAVTSKVTATCLERESFGLCRDSLFLFDDLDFDVDVDGISDQHTAGLQGDVPVEVPILAVDLRAGREAGDGGAHGLFDIPLMLASRTTSWVMPRMVRSP
jgi:hypothetical protein